MNLLHGYKLCKKCNSLLALDDFPPNREYRDGRLVTCRPCYNAKAREYQAVTRRRDPEKYRAAKRRDYAKNPEAYKARARRRYYDNPDAARAEKRDYYQRHREELIEKEKVRYRANIEKKKAYDAAYREARRELRRQQTKDWVKRNPEKARELDTTKRHRRRGATVVEKVDPAYIYKRDGGKCGICGKRVAKKDVSLDHIEPVSAGGVHSNANVQLAHLVCNSRRNRGYLPAQGRLIG